MLHPMEKWADAEAPAHRQRRGRRGATRGARYAACPSDRSGVTETPGRGSPESRLGYSQALHRQDMRPMRVLWYVHTRPTSIKTDGAIHCHRGQPHLSGPVGLSVHDRLGAQRLLRTPVADRAKPNIPSEKRPGIFYLDLTNAYVSFVDPWANCFRSPGSLVGVSSRARASAVGKQRLVPPPKPTAVEVDALCAIDGHDQVLSHL